MFIEEPTLIKSNFPISQFLHRIFSVHRSRIVAATGIPQAYPQMRSKGDLHLPSRANLPQTQLLNIQAQFNHQEISKKQHSQDMHTEHGA
jgi:hypothetical protein